MWLKYVEGEAYKALHKPKVPMNFPEIALNLTRLMELHNRGRG